MMRANKSFRDLLVSLAGTCAPEQGELSSKGIRVGGLRKHPPPTERSAVAVTIAFCRTCDREVHLASYDPMNCPVCSSPLIPMGPYYFGDVGVSSPYNVEIASELYIG